MTRWRFDIVIVNYRRAKSFTENAWKLGELSTDDRISFVSASPSEEEEAVIREWANEVGVNHRYLGRHNRGMGELPRCEYFLGQTGGPENVRDSRYIFTMQDHYLDTTSPWSIWDARFDYRVKGDVVPDGMTFNLDLIDARMQKDGCVAAFADRNNPCWLQIGTARHIAPSGGNFIVRTDQIARRDIQSAYRHLERVCDNTYQWALYAEFMQGPILFHEGAPVLDLKRDRVFTKFEREEFYVAPDDFDALRRKYSETLEGTLLRSYSRSRRVVGGFARRILGK